MDQLCCLILDAVCACLCVCVDVSVSSLNDGFFLVHTDTQNNSGKVLHTHTHTNTQGERKRESYRQTAGQTTRLTDEYSNCRSNGEVLISCSASLFQTHLLHLAQSCRVVNIGVNIHQMAPPARTSDCSLLLIYQPRKDERLSWPSWLACSGRYTHTTGHSSDAGRAQDRESSPAKDRRSATVPCHQLL